MILGAEEGLSTEFDELDVGEYFGLERGCSLSSDSGLNLCGRRPGLMLWHIRDLERSFLASILLDYHYRKSHQSTGPSTVECQARGFAMHEFGVMM